MLTEPPRPRLDLLVVGGVTIDRFEDGREEPGGSVIHVARAAGDWGLRVGIVTAAGSEPVAATGIAELRRLAQLVECQPSAGTITFRHREPPGGRRLWLERSGARVRFTADSARGAHPQAVLFAPVAAEVGAESLEPRARAPVRGAILQGWLRSAAADGEVQALPLSAIPTAIVEALAAFDLLVGSTEDLAAEGRDPRRQLAALRHRFGPDAALMLTDGTAGVWMLAAGPGARARHVPVPRLVERAPTVGAGDIFAAAMLAGWRRNRVARELPARVDRAMRAVAAALEARRDG